jgi:hypothetical protein
MFRRAPWLLAALLIVGMLPSAAHAEGKETATALRFMFYGGTTPLLGSSGASGAGIIGGGAQLNFPFGKSHHWMIAPGGTYGLGHDSDTQISGGSTTKSSSNVHTYTGFLDALYYSDCCDDDDWYCGPGFYYSSTSITDKFTGSSDVKINGIHSYGIQLTEGGGVPMGQKLVLFGGATERIGFTKFDDKTSLSEEKLSAITHSLQFEGGLKVKM